MKVLFAVDKESVASSVIKKYQAEYKEIISAKNVYYFNAIIKELQRDKSYDRIVISENLEPFSNKNYGMMDKFLFEKLDNISDEATNNAGGDIPIIVICTERRNKSDEMLSKMFSIGIYSALIGNDRTVENVCALINRPRTKKDAKNYYRIDADEGGYTPESVEDVNEAEIQNILMHYKKLGRDEEKYVTSFNEIANQYTDNQLKIIARFLPLNVKAVLEEKCPKYQEIMVGSVKGYVKKEEKSKIVAKDVKVNKNKNNRIDLLQNAAQRPKMSDQVVIPGSVNTNQVRKQYTAEPVVKEEILKEPVYNNNDNDNEFEVEPNLNNNIEIDFNESNDTVEEVVTPVKRGRGRPPKKKDINAENASIDTGVKRKRGRPPKQPKAEENEILNTQSDDINLFDLGNSEVNETIVEDNNVTNDTILPGFDDDENIMEENYNDQNQAPSPIIESTDYNTPSQQTNNLWNNTSQYNSSNTNMPTSSNSYNSSNNIANLSVGEGKIVSFVGTSKNGTSFLVNNLAIMLSNNGINTAILDLTENKNAYYIFTKNDERLRNQAVNCINDLRMGKVSGIRENKNLTVYTTVPTENEGLQDYTNILETLSKNYSLVLLDCDFNTNYGYFANSNEIYLVQTFDVLTIQPLTAFLRELLDRNILDPNKLRVVINKAMKIKGLTKEIIIGGVSAYNSPDMTCQKKFFKPESMTNITIPFEDQTYTKYLETLATCELSLNGYSKNLLDALRNLGDMVYPLISSTKTPNYGNYNDYKGKQQSVGFNNNIDNTLNRMRRMH